MELASFSGKRRLSRSLFRESFEYPLVSSPFSATEMLPVSSDTTTTIASEFSLIPIAARCLEPSCLFISSSFCGLGKKQPAASIIPSLIITAPSWSGVFGKNMFPNIAVEGMQLSIVPVAICSPSFVFLSQIISAPVLVEERLAAESHIASIAFFQCSVLSSESLELKKLKPPRLVRPTFSRTRLSSG